MATKIVFDRKCMVFEKNTFVINERDTTFDTSYDVYNPPTGKYVTFQFSHSTGSEWDPNTIWVYKNTSHNLELHITQDKTITEMRSNNYLKHKLKSNG